MLDQIPEHAVSISGSSGVLSDLVPVTAGHIVKAQRRTRRLGLSDCLLGLLALRALYCFGFAARCGFGTAEKAMASHLEVEPEVRRARVSIDRHAGESLRVCKSMNNSISRSVNILRGRRWPWPTVMYRKAPDATYPRSVLMEQRNSPAASRGVQWRRGGEAQASRSGLRLRTMARPVRRG